MDVRHDGRRRFPTFGVFALHQRRRNAAGRDPFVVPTVFRKRSFISGIAVLFAFSAAMSGVFFVYTLFMQIGLHFSALHAGLTMLPWSIGTIASMGASQAPDAEDRPAPHAAGRHAGDGRSAR